jgi:predicted SAM-dependent methyltransferase
MNIFQRMFHSDAAPPPEPATLLEIAVPALAVPEHPRLHLACGYNMIPGWINTDLLPLNGTTIMDFTKPFPYADGSFEAVFCEHSIEHISKSDAKIMCAEVYRVLKPDGRFRVVTPSIEKIATMALSENSEATQAYLNWYRGWAKEPDATVSDTINAMFYKHGHQHLYLRSELCALLKASGFDDIELLEPDEYGHPVFNGVDGHGKVVGEKVNAAEAFAAEAKKT